MECREKLRIEEASCLFVDLSDMLSYMRDNLSSCGGGKRTR